MRRRRRAPNQRGGQASANRRDGVGFSTPRPDMDLRERESRHEEILLAGRTLQDTAWAQSAAQEVALSQRSRGTEEIGRPALPMARAGPGGAPPSPRARHIVPGSYAGLPVPGSPPYTSASCAAAS